MYDFSNKVVLITGGTGALGKTLTQRFISSGATTIATYLKDENIEANKRTEYKQCRIYQS